VFETKGDRPKWAPIYDLLKTKNPGDIVTYDELSTAAGFDILTDRSPFYSAKKRLLENDKRSMVNVPGEGYRVALASEHKAEAQRHQKRGKRQFRKAKNQVRYVRQNELTPEERRSFDEYGNRLAKLEAASINHEGRLRSLENAQTKTSFQVSKHDRELTQLAAKLKALGYAPSKAA
jgi:uncharacterized coiled-coil protein SlyX